MERSASTDTPRYSDKQVAQILHRAAELQRMDGTESSFSSSSEAELFQIGSEIGLHEDSIRRAMEELDGGIREPKRSWLSSVPLSLEVEKVLPVEVDDEQWQDIVASFRRAFGRIGETKDTGAVREWTGLEGGLDPIHWSLHSKAGQSKLRATSDINTAAFLITFITAIFTLISVLVLFQECPLGLGANIGLAALMVAAIGMAIRTWISGLAKRRQTAVQAVLRQSDTVIKPSPAAAQSLPTPDNTAEANLQQGV